MPKITQPLAEERTLLTFTRLDDGAEVADLLVAVQQLSLVRSRAEATAIVRGAARRLAGAEAATIALREDGECVYVDEESVAPLWTGRRTALEDSVSGWAMLDRRPVRIPDISADDRVAAPYRSTFVRSLAVVPIRPRDPIGAIGVYWAAPHEADERELQLLQALADSTAVALEQVRAYSALEDAHTDMLRRLALAAEYRDDTTFRHTARVAHTAVQIARRLGLDTAFVSLLAQAAPLHDVGKIAVSDAILLKPDVLTTPEILHMRAHAVCGAEILAGGTSEVLQMAEEIALTHHEWWDGTGYPNRLAHDEIPLSGRIVALADVFDALIHARPYKQPWTLDEALHEINHLSGRQFDPMVVKAFFDLDEADLVPDSEEIRAQIPGIHGAPDSFALTGSSPTAD